MNARADYERFYRESAVPTVTIDLHARQIIDANDAAGTFLGLDIAEVIGRPGSDMLEEPTEDEVFRTRGLRGERTTAIRTVRTARGPRTAEIHMVPTGVDGQIFVQVVDFSDVIAANVRLDAHAAHLQRKTAALESLTARVAHDVKGPLATVLGFAQLLETRSDRLSAEDREMMLGRIAAVAESLARMVDGMVQDALGVGDADDSTRDARALEEIVRGVYEGDLSLVGGRLAFEVSVEQLPVPIAEVRQPLINLIGNSIKFRADDRPLRIVVSIAPHEDGATIDVVDNGRGFDTDPERLFERGVRGDNVDDAAGTGLGLAYTRSSIEDIGGSVEAHVPEAGIGAGFRITVRPQPEHDEPVVGGTVATGLSSTTLGAILDRTPVPMLVTDLAARTVVRVNDAMSSLVRMPPDEIVGRPAASLLRMPEVGDEARLALLDAPDRVLRFATTIVDGDGRDIEVDVLLASERGSPLAVAQVIPTDRPARDRLWPPTTDR